MGIEEEKIDQIIDEHIDVVDALKKERDGYKSDAGKLADVQRKLDAYEKNNGDGKKTVSKEDYDALKTEYDNYKADITAKEIKAAKESAFRELVKAAGVSEKRISSIIKVSDIDGIELDKDGKIKDAEELSDKIKSEWADFIPTVETKGAETAKPPVNSGKASITKADIYKKDEHGKYILTALERQKALAENPELLN